MSQERGSRRPPRRRARTDGQRRRRGERDEEGRNSVTDPAGYDVLVDDDWAVGDFAVVVFIVLSASRWPCRRPATGDPPALAQRGG
jgi:hypothetical protein